jgi:hypothetical protein
LCWTQLSIDTTSHGNENLEALAPLVISLQHAGTEAAYLRSLDKFVEEREKNIEEICGDNYEVCDDATRNTNSD